MRGGIGQAVMRALPCIQTKGHRAPCSSWMPIPACCAPRIGTDSFRVHMRFSVSSTVRLSQGQRNGARE
jgi:hypothetical protein